jgi:Chromatin associated protein KTI12
MFFFFSYPYQSDSDLLKFSNSFISRWDSPLFLSLAANPLDLTAVAAGIFERAAPPPNQSTQCQPLSSANFLHEVDKVSDPKIVPAD